MITLIEYFLLLLPIGIHLLVDKKGTVHHVLNAIYVTALSIAVGLVLPGYFWQGAFYALTLHFCFFDIFYNLMHQHAWNYHGTSSNPHRSFTDRAWASQYLSHPLVEIFVRLWMLSIGIGVYYHLDWIIN
jgi:hypothetical protein